MVPTHPTRAYIGSFTTAGGPGITVARLDARTGALTAPHPAVGTVVNPSFLAVSPVHDVLYSVSETEEGALAAFSLAGDPDRPEPLCEPVPVGGDGPTHLAVGHDGRRVFTANYGSGSVSALPLDGPAGVPGAPTAVLPHRGGGPVPDRQSAPHAHAVVPDPSGRWLLSVDLGTDSVWISALDGATGDPVPHRETALGPGSGPRTLVFHPRGHRAYVLNELAPTLTVCRWDAASGTLEPLEEVRVVPPGAHVPTYPSTPVLSPDGRFLWTANRGDDTLAVLALDADGDRPELRATVDCGGRWPRHLTAHGGLLYVANERSGDVTWFTVEPGTGMPRKGGAVAVPAASCVAFA
ncbi:lactonase family protein [Streptomyces luteireticuli]|uniref:Lactonase family protein n=1 Tax=Streptomyces luteireticuli TaxID=173858 RepID=A0ABN0YPU7_9ACTN